MKKNPNIKTVILSHHVFIACIGYVLPGISLHLFRADNGLRSPLLVNYNEDLLNFVFKHSQFPFVTGI
jgi:hypothetical protein